MLFAFRKDCQYDPDTVGGRPALYREVYNSRGCFGVTRFTAPRDACERYRFGMLRNRPKVIRRVEKAGCLSGRPASKIHGWRSGRLHVERMLRKFVTLGTSPYGAGGRLTCAVCKPATTNKKGTASREVGAQLAVRGLIVEGKD
jgi:hypothetical protein